MIELLGLQNVCNIFSSFQLAAPEKLVNNYSQTDYFFSAAIFLTFFNTTQYLEYYSKYYVLISTVRHCVLRWCHCTAVDTGC